MAKRRRKNTLSNSVRKRKISRKKKNKYVLKLFLFFITILIVVATTILYLRYRSYIADFFSNREQPVFRIPQGYSVHGIDVSHHQKQINWMQVSDCQMDSIKIEFAFIKATEGKDWKDTCFDYNIRAARGQGLLCGAYHFYNPRTNSTEQAKNFINTVCLKPGDLPPVLDIELISLYGMENLRKGIRNWLKIIENHYGVKPIIYTNNSYHKDYLLKHGFEEYPFWIAHYYIDSVDSQSNWIFWQHTDKGKVKGIQTDVDMNVFRGTSDDLKLWCVK